MYRKTIKNYYTRGRISASTVVAEFNFSASIARISESLQLDGPWKTILFNLNFVSFFSPGK